MVKKVAALNGSNNNIRTMAILTSENPRYNVSSDGENVNNADRRENLEKDLKLGHYAWFPVKGQYEGKENSYIVYNISLDNALHLGRKFGQESIVFIEDGHCQYWEQSGDGKYTKTIVCPDGCVIFRLTATPLGNENFHKGKFWDYPDQT